MMGRFAGGRVAVEGVSVLAKARTTAPRILLSFSFCIHDLVTIVAVDNVDQ